MLSDISHYFSFQPGFFLVTGTSKATVYTILFAGNKQDVTCLTSFNILKHFISLFFPEINNRKKDV